MLKKKIEDILNDQIEKEGYSSNLYLAMATWSEANGYGGIAKWMYAQADEERIHMLKIISYIHEKGGHAIVPAFKAPPADYTAVKPMFDEVMKHEQYITESINNIVHLCLEEKDYTTHGWVQWFVNEQIEEESQVSEIQDKLNLLGDQNLYLIDRDILSLRGGASEGE